jgi:23S rRNA (adenine2503-C2)-methyltransferase
LYDLTYAELDSLLGSWGEPGFRAEQVWKWLYSSLVGDFEAMANLPKTLRKRLANECDLRLLTALSEQESASGQTSKVLFRLSDGSTIESVLMRYHDRSTACISTQVGCGMGCVFCATGLGGLVRNLSPGEILAQVVYFAREIRVEQIDRATEQDTRAQLASHPIRNIVLMGMGEPLANYEAMWQAIETLADERGYNLGARRITLSTVGLVPAIRRLADEGLPINLAVSLHAADNGLRDELVPINRRYPLDELIGAVREYIEKTGRRVTFEVALIDRVNDQVHQAKKLADLLQGLICHVNLIPLNPIPGSALRPSPREQVSTFRDVLEGAGIAVTVRMRRGISIEAGCGQLRMRRADAEAGSMAGEGSG